VLRNATITATSYLTKYLYGDFSRPNSHTAVAAGLVIVWHKNVHGEYTARTLPGRGGSRGQSQDFSTRGTVTFFDITVCGARGIIESAIHESSTTFAERLFQEVRDRAPEG